jgi:hypothetical protein
VILAMYIMCMSNERVFSVHLSKWQRGYLMGGKNWRKLFFFLKKSDKTDSDNAFWRRKHTSLFLWSYKHCKQKQPTNFYQERNVQLSSSSFWYQWKKSLLWERVHHVLHSSLFFSSFKYHLSSWGPIISCSPQVPLLFYAYNPLW